MRARLVVPSENEWNDGIHHATCYVTIADGSDALTGSVKGRADDFARGDIVAIDRLMPGDCFDPAGSTDPFSLRSSDMVRLADCSGTFFGVFFGRGNFPYPDDMPIPSDDDLTDSSTTACSTDFESFFDVESAVGYTFRFWRPSQSRWDGGDREVLCAVLSDEPIDGPYLPVGYPQLHKLGTGQCFRLLPEQTDDSLSLDDHVRPVRCSELHSGQMIGGGLFDVDLAFPATPRRGRSRSRNAGVCSRRSWASTPPIRNSESFPTRYPNEEAWTAGDTRYACAILESGLTESLQGSRR